MGNTAPASKIAQQKNLGVKSLSEQPGIMASLPRREFVQLEPTDVNPPMMKSVSYTAGFIQIIINLARWLMAGFSIGTGQDRQGH